MAFSTVSSHPSRPGRSFRSCVPPGPEETALPPGGPGVGGLFQEDLPIQGDDGEGLLSLIVADGLRISRRSQVANQKEADDPFVGEPLQRLRQERLDPFEGLEKRGSKGAATGLSRSSRMRFSRAILSRRAGGRSGRARPRASFANPAPSRRWCARGGGQTRP